MGCDQASDHSRAYGSPTISGPEGPRIMECDEASDHVQPRGEGERQCASRESCTAS